MRTPIKYGSVCSGIEAATVAWHGLGWQPQWFSEIEPFPCRALQHHYPQVPNLGDMTKINEHDIYHERTIDLLVGGTPCQSFSVAGLRAGLDDERGNLALEYCRILQHKRPRWFVWENVPGVLSSKNGADFACILSAFTGQDIQPQRFETAGVISGQFYSIAYRVLDAQYFGVPQRRRRVFVVGYLGNDWRPPFAVLFDSASLQGHPAPRRQPRQKITTGTGAGTAESSWWDGGQVADTLTKSNANGSQRMPDKDNFHAVITPYTAAQFGAYQEGVGTDRANGGANGSEDISHTINTSANSSSRQAPNIMIDTIVRRMTPKEVGRLQGFPDGYLEQVPKYSDTQAYRAFGNSMAVPVMKWIGSRIDLMEDVLYELNHKP